MNDRNILLFTVIVIIMFVLESHADEADGGGCSAVGCANPELLVGTTLLRRDDDRATIHCNSTGRQWALKCRKSVWVPISPDDEHHLRNCSVSSAIAAAGMVHGAGRQLTSSAAAGLTRHPPDERVSNFPFSTSFIIM